MNQCPELNMTARHSLDTRTTRWSVDLGDIMFDHRCEIAKIWKRPFTHQDLRLASITNRVFLKYRWLQPMLRDAKLTRVHKIAQAWAFYTLFYPFEMSVYTLLETLFLRSTYMTKSYYFNLSSINRAMKRMLIVSLELFIGFHELEECRYRGLRLGFSRPFKKFILAEKPAKVLLIVEWIFVEKRFAGVLKSRWVIFGKINWNRIWLLEISWK